MNQDSRPNQPFHVLATDLDGTLIPLEDNRQNLRDLNRLTELIHEYQVTLAFVTGRHLASVQKARLEFSLPRPDWIICDVGTSIYRSCEQGPPQAVADYQDHLEEMIAAFPLKELRKNLKDRDALRLQEEEKQGRFKLSYYVEAGQLEELAAELEDWLNERNAPYSLISSVDPFTGDGLLDFLPRGVSKAYALNWWCDYAGHARSSVLFSGDSGNDLAAFIAGYRVIVVRNADRNVARQVHDCLKNDEGFVQHLYLAHTPATSGVLEGCLWYGMFPHDEPQDDSLESLACPWGATPLSWNRTHFRVWAPKRRSVSVETRRGVEVRLFPLDPEDDGHFSRTIDGIGPLDFYRYRLDGNHSRPDPVSRYQPQGVHGDSLVVDPRFPWTDQDWEGVTGRDLVIFEAHVGTWTQEGTFLSAIEKIRELKELGVTAVELLPVVQTPGRWNWGYDGVNLFAPRNTYGTPEDFKAFVDHCHAEGLAVILDVVYNHVGPEGNYWADFAGYYSEKHHTPWGEAFAFDGPDAAVVRRFVVENALYWLREYHLDGLRLDAVHCMYDDSRVHILEEIRAAVADFKKSVKRQIHLIAEANIYDPELLPPDPNSHSYDAAWCDDIMHSIYAVIAPGTNVTHREYKGPIDLAESLEHGFIYRGMPQQRMTEKFRQKDPVSPAVREGFVIALQTHDNVGNHPHGWRVHQLTSPAHQKAAAALVLLYPAIPLIFMGEEIAASAPFRFFVDFEDENLRQAVDQGRAKEYPDQVWDEAVSPIDERAFRESIVSESDDPSMFAWYQSLLAIRTDWQKQGLLSAERFSVIWEPAANLFGYRYLNPNGKDAFVLARLFPAGDSPKPVSVHLEGELLLDSAGDEPASRGAKFDVSSARALVGLGEFEF